MSDHPSTDLRPLPDPRLVLRALADSGVAVPLTEAERLLTRAAAVARAHTRGGGFSPDGMLVRPELADMLVASVARSLGNPERALATWVDGFSGRPGTFGEWSIEELHTLSRHRAG